MFKYTKSATAAMVNAKASCAASEASSVLVINALSIRLGVLLITDDENALWRKPGLA